MTTEFLATALLAALSCVATLVIRIPSPTGGYMNLGDTVVLLGAYLLGGNLLQQEAFGADQTALGHEMVKADLHPSAEQLADAALADKEDPCRIGQSYLFPQVAFNVKHDLIHQLHFFRRRR